MKISNTIILPAMLMCAVSLSAFTLSNTQIREVNEIEKPVPFDAKIAGVFNSNKVSLIVDRPDNAYKLRVVLRGKDNKVYFSEIYREKNETYKRVFDVADLTEGTYFFEIYYQKKVLVKEVNIQSSSQKLISLL